LWQLLQEPTNWFAWLAGALWHDAHPGPLGCENAQLLPGFLWQLLQAPGLWPAGFGWQSTQFARASGCENVQLTPGFL
jgi:hypothetical protein